MNASCTVCLLCDQLVRNDCDDLPALVLVSFPALLLYIFVKRWGVARDGHSSKAEEMRPMSMRDKTHDTER